MTNFFYNSNVENISLQKGSIPLVDQEAVHRIRQQARIERVKVVRQFFAMIKRTSFKRMAGPSHIGGGVS